GPAADGAEERRDGLAGFLAGRSEPRPVVGEDGAEVVLYIGGDAPADDGAGGGQAAEFVVEFIGSGIAEILRGGGIGFRCCCVVAGLRVLVAVGGFVGGGVVDGNAGRGGGGGVQVG